jgi:hypothetical protein
VDEKAKDALMATQAWGKPYMFYKEAYPKIQATDRPLGDDELVLGARHGHVEEPPVLLERFVGVEGQGV